MEEKTTNYNLIKPDENEFYDIGVQNDNMDIVDAVLKEHENGIADTKDSTATFTEATTEEDIVSGEKHSTLFGKILKSINTFRTSISSLSSQLAQVVKAEKAGGTATVITLTSVALIDGALKTFIATSSNGAASTTINGKPLYKPGTTTAPKLVDGKAVTVWYDATGGCFFIKASAEGDATADNVLAGKTFSNDSDTSLAGTMTNNGPTASEIVSLTTEGAEYTIPAGYHSGLRKIKAEIVNIAAAVIKAGVTVGGIVGTFTADATATAAQLLSGVTAYVNGSKITGSMIDNGAVNQSLAINGTYAIPAGYHNGSGKVTQSITTKSAATYNPSTSAQTIAASQYLSGAQTIAATTGTANTAQVLSGYTFDSANGIGLTGGMTNRGAVAITPGTSQQAIGAGYHNGSGYVVGDGNLVASNILNGVSIFGVAGSVIAGKRYASSTVTSSSSQATFYLAGGTGVAYYYITVGQSFGFTPSTIVAISYNDGGITMVIYTGNYSGYNGAHVFTAICNYATGSSVSYQFGSTNTYVNSSGFQLPATAAGKTYTWYAYE